MNTLSRAGLTLVALALCVTVIPACGPATQTGSDAGSGTDAGGVDAGNAEDAGPGDAGAARHHSYVPAGLHPTSVARIIVMGDSISAGYGTTNPSSGATPYTSLAYYNLLEANNNTVWPAETSVSLSTEFSATNIPIVNVAVPGATTASMISSPDQRKSLDSDLFASASTVSGYTIVVMTIGGNDLVAQLETDLETGSASTASANLTNGLANVRTVLNYFTAAKFPDGVGFYLANVYDPSGGTGMLTGACAQSIAGVDTPVSDPNIEGVLANWDSGYVSLAQEFTFVAVVDAHGGFLTHGVTATDTYFYKDCIHPDNEGHNELRNLFFEAIDGSYIAPDN